MLPDTMYAFIYVLFVATVRAICLVVLAKLPH